MIDTVLGGWAIAMLLLALAAHRMGRVHMPPPPKPQYDAPLIPAPVAVDAVINHYEHQIFRDEHY